MGKARRTDGLYALLAGLFALQPAYADYGARPAATMTGITCTAPNKAIVDYDGVIGHADPKLAEALRRFPKGADIHNHLSGTIMPQDYVDLGIGDRDCYGPAGASMYKVVTREAGGDCPADYKPLGAAGSADRNRIWQSLSMYRYTYPDTQHGHDQFFATFGRFGAVSGSPCNTAPMLVKLLQQADRDSVSYVETMMSFQSQAVSELGKLLRRKYPDDASYRDSGNYPAMFAFLQDVGLDDAIAGAQRDLTRYVSKTRALLKCDPRDNDSVCRVSYAFLASVNRNADLAQVFAQTAFSMRLATADERVVGVNLLSGEDADASMQNFETQMQYFGYFHTVFPEANIALHAGELTPCFVGQHNPALMNHLVGSLRAGAKRLGHGVSFAYLSPADKWRVATLMKADNAMVEIMFTSNAQILGVTGHDHPFRQYMRLGVPLAFATDDEGVSFGNFTNEWIYGVEAYGLTGDDLVRLARASLQYSFIKGAPLWADLAAARPVAQCANIKFGIPQPPAPCQAYLDDNAKAKAQWAYEARLQTFLQSPLGRRLRSRLH